MDYDEVERIAKELEELLRPQYPAQAEFIKQLGRLASQGEMAELKLRFAGLAMWGGAGSVADANLCSTEANERMNALLVRLVEHFEKEGITYPRATMWAAIFREWEKRGVYRN